MFFLSSLWQPSKHSNQPPFLSNCPSSTPSPHPPPLSVSPSSLLLLRFVHLPLQDLSSLLSSTMLFARKCRFLSLPFLWTLLLSLHSTYLFLLFFNGPSPSPPLMSVLYLLLYSFASQHGSFLAFLQCWTLDTETNRQPQTLLYIYKYIYINLHSIWIYKYIEI